MSEKNMLFHCPCDGSRKCAMDDPCLGCEVYAEWCRAGHAVGASAEIEAKDKRIKELEELSERMARSLEVFELQGSDKTESYAAYREWRRKGKVLLWF